MHNDRRPLGLRARRSSNNEPASVGPLGLDDRAFAESIQEQLEKLGENVFVIGEIVKGKGVVRER